MKFVENGCCRLGAMEGFMIKKLHRNVKKHSHIGTTGTKMKKDDLEMKYMTFY